MLCIALKYICLSCGFSVQFHYICLESVEGTYQGLSARIFRLAPACLWQCLIYTPVEI